MTNNLDDDPEELPEASPSVGRRVPRAERVGNSVPGFREERFLMQVRSATRYATLRTVVDVSAVISILALAIMLLLILVGGALGRGSDADVGAVVLLVLGAVMIALVVAARQASILFVDIADILIWHGSRASKDRS